MEHVRSFDGTRIAYAVQGTGPAVLLLHGFAADHVLNWAQPGVIDALTAAGVDYDIVTYPDAADGFFCEAQPDRFDPDAAADAWTRTVDFIYERLEG